MGVEQEIAKANAKAKVLRKELASQITKTSKFGIVSEDLFQTQLEAFFDIAFNAGREVGMLECQREVVRATDLKEKQSNG